MRWSAGDHLVTSRLSSSLNDPNWLIGKAPVVSGTGKFRQLSGDGGSALSHLRPRWLAYAIELGRKCDAAAALNLFTVRVTWRHLYIPLTMNGQFEFRLIWMGQRAKSCFLLQHTCAPWKSCSHRSMMVFRTRTPSYRRPHSIKISPLDVDVVAVNNLFRLPRIGVLNMHELNVCVGSSRPGVI